MSVVFTIQYNLFADKKMKSRINIKLFLSAFDVKWKVCGE